MIFVGIILIIIGVGLFFYRKKLQAKLLDIKYFDKTDIKSVLDICNSISNELGSGQFSQMVKVEVNAKSDEPLSAEFTKTPCVYYKSSAEEHYESLVETTDSNGKKIKNWVSGTNFIGESEVGGVFRIEDASGAIEVDLAGADLTLDRPFTRSVNETRQSVNFSFGTFNPRSDSRYKTTGYATEEEFIKVDQKLFVIGDFNDRDGVPKISKPEDDNQQFIISVKSEKQMVAGLDKKINSTKIGAIACISIGVILSIVHFFV